MIKNAKKNIRVLRELFYLRLHGLMVFRLDFIAPFFIDGSLFFIQLLAFGAVYAHVDRVGNWGKGEMILYIGTFSLINAFNMTVYFFGINNIPNKVRSGELDLYLSKPVSPLFRLTFENISPGSIPLVIMSICVIAHGVRMLPMPLALPGILGYAFWVLVMTILYYEMAVIIRAVSLYIVSMARLEQLEEACLGLCMKLPGIAFYGGYKLVFYFILPYGIMATLPVQRLTGEMNLQTGIYGLGIVALFSVVTAVIWTQGLKHYNSASS